jgi:hypothetical protein
LTPDFWDALAKRGAALRASKGDAIEGKIAGVKPALA